MNAVTQTRFAELTGFSKSWITALKQRGRLVMTDGGKVDVEASLERIRETAEPNRDDVAARWARARTTAPQAEAAETFRKVSAEKGNVPQPPEAEAEPDAADAVPGTLSFQAARAKKEHYLAAKAEAEFGEMIGELTRAAEVRAMGARLGALVRTHVERLEVLADVLAAETDAARVRAHITEHAEAALAELAEAVSRLSREADRAAP